MKIAIILGRGIEGCGVTRSAIELHNYYVKKGIEVHSFASNDKKWGRRSAQDNQIQEFNNDQIPALAKRLNSEFDVVFYKSIPSKNEHSQEYQQLFFNYLLSEVQKPIKISFQMDHSARSLARNYKLWEAMAHMDACLTHSLGSAFSKKMKDINPKVPVLKMGLGFDYDSLKQYWVDTKIQQRKACYFGRFAGFKDPFRMIDLQPYLAKHNILTEMRGIERSIGSLPLFYEDTSDRANTYRKNIYEVKKGPVPEHTVDKVHIYGPYNRMEGIVELSKSMFGADFYNLKPDSYGDNMEFAMCEILAVGSIALFDKHWADNCTHLNGTKFSDLRGFAVYVDKNDLYTAAAQMNELSNNHELRHRFRTKAFELAKEHSDNSIVYGDIDTKSRSVVKKAYYAPVLDEKKTKKSKEILTEE